MSKILVALDGSPASEKALEAAVKLALHNGGQLTAVTVLDNVSDPRLSGLVEKVKHQARRHLEELLQAATNFARSRGVRLLPILREGHPANAIVACAEDEKAQLLILGNRTRQEGTPGLGGTADQVTSHAPCTVMVVK
jgi:nucleotide-binding universal stress UspA family protein